MDSEGLTLSIEYLTSTGVVLSTEQKAALQTSLIMLQNAQKFHKVQLWGKIVGIKESYFIASGISKGNELQDRKFLYSQDCMKWSMLPILAESRAQMCRSLSGRFIGDPTYEYEYIDVKVVGEGEEAEEETNTVLVKEEDRLAAVIDEIDREVHIVPRGSYVKTAAGKIVTNRSFEGLNNLDCKKLSSYFHFKSTPNTDKINLLAKWVMDNIMILHENKFMCLPDQWLRVYFTTELAVYASPYTKGLSVNYTATLDQSIDFLENVEHDLPKGCWALHLERGSGLVILKSLLWLGYSFYHVPGTKKYGSTYFGNGEKNIDLPFML